MLIFDFALIGNRLYSIRKKTGMTQADVAEKAGISDRTYADIERGTVNMRVETLLRICNVLKITPNEILSNEKEQEITTENITELLNSISSKERKIVFKLLEAYLKNS
ncbi:MAG: helix-turn-helix transcriptional regulator [Clostridia bacterium]|nr:helix-turn-helix transcriptional regulator [Clostridia bacterium]